MSSHLARSLRSALAVAVVALSNAGCDSSSTPPDTFEVTYAPDFATATWVPEVTNPFFPLVPGTSFRYVGDTPDGEEEVEIDVTTDTRVVAGVTARVVRAREFIDGELVEDTFDWYAQDAAGNVWYLGEDTREYEGGVVVSTAGSWEAGVDGARAGILMPAAPSVGQAYYQEIAEGVAEDRAEVVATGVSVTTPLGSFSGCVRTLDTTPLEPDVRENKTYCSGLGTVLEVDLESGTRIELVEVSPP